VVFAASAGKAVGKLISLHHFKSVLVQELTIGARHVFCN